MKYMALVIVNATTYLHALKGPTVVTAKRAVQSYHSAGDSGERGRWEIMGARLPLSASCR